MARTARALASVVLTGALLAGCAVLGDGGTTAPDAGPATSPPAAASPGPSPAGTPPAEPGPTADTVRAGGVPVPVGDRTVLHAAADGGGSVATSPAGDVTLLTVDGPPGAPVAVLLAAPPGGTVDVQDDGSFVVLAGDGTFLGGAARPVTVGAVAPVRVRATGDGVLRASADDGDLEVRVAAAALAGAEWGEREGGRSLAVTPTPWARSAGRAGELAVWTELVAAVPEADTPVMRDQLTCHAFGAPDKETWNLEPWRPDVGLLGVLAAACNPA